MSKVYFTSDPHFEHEKLCQGLRNMSSKESDKLIIDNWNSTITKRDRVYIVGDVSMENPKVIARIMPKLKGDIVIIGGNHCTLPCCREYMKLGIPVMGVLQYHGFLCTHIPVHPTQLYGFKGNIHGHVHLSGIIKDLGVYDPPQLEGPYYNVNVEFHDYKPVLFEDIKQYFIENYGIKQD